MENHHDNFVSDRIMQRIKNREVKMRSRWYFVLRDVLGVTAIIILLLVAIYVASFVIFVLHQSGAWFVPVFGLSGWWSLFNALPWILISLTVVFTILLAILVKRFPFGYKWPLIYSLLAIGFLIAAASFLTIQTSLVQKYFMSSAARGVPLFGEYYPGIGVLSPNDVHRGQIVGILPDGFRLQDGLVTPLRVLVSTATVFSPSVGLHEGDRVVVFGLMNEASGTIRAVGVEKL